MYGVLPLNLLLFLLLQIILVIILHCHVLRKLQQIPQPNFQSCLLMNISQCHWTENGFNDALSITVYNPLSRPVSHYVRIPLSGNSNYKLFNSDGNYK